MLAGVIPAVYVVADVLFITKRFNAITTIVAITAVTQGGLAFLKVDGWKYAMQDTAGTAVLFLLYAVMLAFRKPIVAYFIPQVFGPANSKEEHLIWRLLFQPVVYRAVFLGTGILLIECILRGVFNFYINWYRVTAAFETEEFNLQKRNVDAITRIVAPVTNIAALIVAYQMVERAIDEWLEPVAEDGGNLFEQVEKRFAWEEASKNRRGVEVPLPETANNR